MERKLVINEYLGFCDECASVMEQVMKTYTDASGRRRKTLELERHQRLVISPDYNHAGALTHFHVDLARRGDSI